MDSTAIPRTMKPEHYRLGKWHFRIDERMNGETYYVRVDTEENQFEFSRINSDIFNVQIKHCELSDADTFDCAVKSAYDFEFGEGSWEKDKPKKKIVEVTNA